METGQRKKRKKARVDPPVAPLVTCTVHKSKLQCPVCTHLLKPPILQCAAGHLACGACHGQLGDNDRCYKCAHPGGYSRNLPLEDVVRSTKVWCPNYLYGCNSSVMNLYEMEDHESKCPAAPCRCSEPGCAVLGSPSWFSDHLRFRHSWSVWSIGYSKAWQLQLPESKPRCLLVAKEDGRVFIVSVGARRRRRGVSLVCLRRNATAGPQYTCKMWVTGSAAAATGKLPIAVFAEMDVPSSAVTGNGGEDVGADTETGDKAALVVHRKMLHGPSKELHLIVLINKVKVQT